MAGPCHPTCAVPPAAGTCRALPPLLLAVLLLSRAALPSAAPAPQAATLEEEAGLMQQMRELVRAAGSRMTHMAEGWAPADPAPHCRWAQVTCDDDGRVARLALWDKGFASPQSAVAPHGDAAAAQAAVAELVALLPGLQWLIDLELGPGLEQLPAGCLPPGWLEPSAFPRLRRLSISSRCLPGPLPDIPAGALPALKTLVLTLADEEPAVHLPASWGASPDVLPALRQMLLTLPHGAAAALPPGWAGGFRALEHLNVQGKPAPAPPTRPPRGHRAGQAAIPSDDEVEGQEGGKQEDASTQPAAGRVDGGGGGGTGLPNEWASGFPRLVELIIAQLPLGGTLPTAWADGGFPALRSLTLSALGLTGTLPPHLFEFHPHLNELQLTGNRLAGSLPPEWASSQQLFFLDASYNQLTGAAFPPAWLASGALLNLQLLRLGGNPGLGGDLPQKLPWTNLRDLDLFGTGVQGSVPAAWCKAPFAVPFFTRWLTHPGAGGDLELPPCAAEVVPMMALQPHPNATRPPNWVPGAAAGGGGAAGAGEPSSAGRLALLVGLATVLPLAVAAAVGAAGRALWLRRTRRAQAAQHERDRESLLRRGRSGDARGGGGGGGGTGRWARLAAVVRSTLGSGRDGIEMLPHTTVPSALVHQLGSRRGRPGGGGGGLPSGPNVSAASSWADAGADSAGRHSEGQRLYSAVGGSKEGSAGNSAASAGGGGSALHSAAFKDSGASSRSGSLPGGPLPPTLL